jgi:hypothetical protein
VWRLRRNKTFQKLLKVTTRPEKDKSLEFPPLPMLDAKAVVEEAIKDPIKATEKLYGDLKE